MNLKNLWPFGRKSVNFGDGFIRNSTSFVSPYWSHTAGARGPAWENSAVMACMAYLMRTMPDAKFRVKLTKGDEEETLPKHPLYDLVKMPNPSAGYMWSDIASAIGVALSLDGNAYLRKRRNNLMQPGALEYVPFLNCEPKEREQGMGLTHYSVYNGRFWEDVAREDIVHFRIGIDEQNTLKGMSVFKSVVKEVATDNEATVYCHAILKNLGVLGFLITPTGDNEFVKEQAVELENRILRQYTGEDRGKPAVLAYDAKVQTVGASPQQMAITDTRKTPEERISAVFGIPAIVAGLGAGLDRSTFANMKEAREMAAESCNAPLWARMGETMTAGLSESLKPGEYIEFDLSTVRALQEDEDAKHERARANFEKGIWKRSESRTYTGKVATPEDEVYNTDLQAQMAKDRSESELLAREARESQSRAKALEGLDRLDV
jgi:HK97 family phage portal protein